MKSIFENVTTTSSSKPMTVSMESMKKLADRVEKMGFKPPKTSWFEKIMNRFGWHREYELLIVDHRKLFGWMK